MKWNIVIDDNGSEPDFERISGQLFDLGYEVDHVEKVDE
jgi:hypothetical protein